MAVLEPSSDYLALKDLESCIAAKINQIKEMNLASNEAVCKQVKFIEEEIEIRIESVKIRLDEMLDRFRCELQEIQQDMIDHICVNIEEQESGFHALMCQHKNINEKVLKCEEIMLKLNEQIRKSSDMKFKLRFDESAIGIVSDDVGKIVYARLSDNTPIRHEEIKHKIQDGDFETIELGLMPWDMCVFPNDTLACCDINSNYIAVYDKNLKLIRTVVAIDGKRFQPIGIHVNQRNQIYVTDRLSESVIMVSTDFEKIESTDGRQQFANITSLCSSQQFLYAADFSNRRVHVLDFNLKFIDFIHLECNPVCVGVSNETLCVNGTHFYDTSSKQMKHKIGDNYWTKLSVQNSLFYVFSSDSSKFSCFNADGICIDDISAKRICHTVTLNHDGCMFYFNDALLISSFSGKKLIKFN